MKIKKLTKKTYFEMIYATVVKIEEEKPDPGRNKKIYFM